MDFSNCTLSGTYYGGSERKIGVLVDGAEYMLKFQKKTPFGIRNNHISEYITDTQRLFYKHMIMARYENIIKHTYKSM